ncbi:DUF6493 family protein [Cellulosimicrobium sp. Marseille-Q4280]|uniref:DUF6493 family protein n=1 Tax=Cellulosimicrobium sp. Marseille-Q4280 TaxID=2937992 RepID=UPI00203B0271|nr:DUF6493 family protein [Cellulosimicrobium sp. Marseille-Q4280]
MTAGPAAGVRYEDLCARLTGRTPLDEVVAFLAPLSEPERRALGRGLSAAIERNEVERAALEHRATFLALLGCATNPRGVSSHLWRLRVDRADVDLALQVLADRSPLWLGQLAQVLVDAGDTDRTWGLVRALVRAGICARPEGDEYRRALVSEVGTGAPGGAIGLLRSDPRLVEDELWEVLGTERMGRQLAQVDSWATHPERTWQHALVVLQSAEGEPRLDRARLLDVTVDALVADRAAVDVRWFVNLHDALDVTPQETVDRQDRYLVGLANEVSTVVRLCQRQLGRIAGRGLDVEALLDASPVVLEHRTKGVVQAHRALLSTVSRSMPEVAPRVAEVIVERSAPAATLLPDPAPLAPALPIRPVDDTDELVELAARVLEEPCEIPSVERLLDGIARWPDGARLVGARALAARAEQVLEMSWVGPWQGAHPGADVAALLLAWLLGVRPPRATRYRGWFSMPSSLRPDPDGALPLLRPADSLGVWWSLRVREVAEHAARGADGRPLLALPTTDDGVVDRAAVTERLVRVPAGAPPLRFDVALAALRLPVDAAPRLPAKNRTAATLGRDLGRRAASSPRWEQVVADVPADDHVLEGPTVPVASWRDAGAPRSRRAGDDPIDALLRGPDALVRFPGDIETLCTHPWPLMFPHHPDLLAAYAHGALIRSVRASRCPTPVLAGLGRAAGASSVTASALVLGLSAKDPVGRVAAADALADLAGRGVLDGADLGREIGRLVAAGAVVGSRVARSMQDAGRSHTPAAALVAVAVTTLLPVLGRRPDAHLFVAALADAATATGQEVTLPSDLEALAASRSRTVLAVECRRVPRRGATGTATPAVTPR